MTIEELNKYKKILILGYGIEGKATEKFLQTFCPDVEILIADQIDGPDYLHKQDEVDLVIKSPGVSRKLVYKPYTTATNIFFANTHMTTIGVTGTKGKSTLCSLLQTIFEVAGKKSFLLGNIGNPMIESVEQEYEKGSIAIVELSSYQLEDIKYSPHVACLLNIFTETHNHDSYKAYFEAKSNITKYQTEKDYFVYNPSFKEIQEVARKTKAKTIPISKAIPFNVSNSTLIGNHNVTAVCTAYAIAKIFDVSESNIEAGVATYKGLPHRLQYVGKFKGITFYDDSAANNPAATLGALEALTVVDTLFLGGQDRGFDFAPVVSALKENNVKTLILFPNTQEILLKLLHQSGQTSMHILTTSSMQDAVEFAFAHTPTEGVCLLSPGAPSYLMYKNFKERGDDFVQKITTHETHKNT